MAAYMPAVGFVAVSERRSITPAILAKRPTPTVRVKPGAAL
jgi:hypothetical protein